MGDATHLGRAETQRVGPKINGNLIAVLGSQGSEVGSERFTRELGAPQGRA
jgi:hypothetical protein